MEIYFFFLLLTIPITSFLIFPAIQGTTPSTLLALGTLLVVSLFIGNKQEKRLYFYTLLLTTSSFLFIVLNSQLFMGLTNEVYDFTRLTLIDENVSGSVLFKNSLFTQSLYFMVSLVLLSFVAVFYNPTYDKFILIGAAFLSVYGVYLWIYYHLTGLNGDFISNRIFGDEISTKLQRFQLITFGGFTTLRIASLTGEPSMYAFTVFPFFLYAIYLKRKFIAVLLFFTLALSTSSTFIIALAISSVFLIKKLLNNAKRIYIALWIMFISILFIISGKFNELLQKLIFDKLYIRNSSGIGRSDNFFTHIDFYINDLPFQNKLFGIGFGYVRSTDLFSTLLVNAGIVGLVLFSLLFLIPIVKLGKDSLSKTLKVILISLYIMMMISVPEYSYLSTWLFLGIAYNQMLTNKINKTTMIKEKQLISSQ